MVETGIHEGDFLAVGCIIHLTDGKIVVSIDGDVIVRKVLIKNGTSSLIATNPKFKSIEIDKQDDEAF